MSRSQVLRGAYWHISTTKDVHMFFWRPLFVCLALSQTAEASETMRFDAYLLGIKAGRLTLSAKETNTQYAISGRVRVAGIMDAFSDFSIDAEVIGETRSTTRMPQRYKERLINGAEDVTKSLDYSGNVPRFKTTEDPKRHWLIAAEQSGTLDPLTAIWELLRDRDITELCILDAEYFDGARRSRLVAQPGPKDGDLRTCTGTYTRIGGFTRRELRSGTEFPFQLYYQASGETWQLQRMDIRSTRGRAQLIRR
ncbi:MAG: DUF3108 domain-containing protein [Marinovum sp.]|nr:DUF3108 domain-containing protein [Marinovum sp.]